MSRLTWNDAGSRFYEAGVERGVLYIDGQPGVAWNGLTSVTEKPSGGDSSPFYLDGVKFLNSSSSEEFEATIEAFTYPDEFEQCDGTATYFNGLLITGQQRKSFGLSYRTKIGNDLDGSDHGYKIHLIYNARVSPTQRTNKTLSNSTDLTTFSWDVTTTPPPIVGYKPTAHFVIDSIRTDPAALMAIENILYGTDSNLSSLPTPTELIDLFTNNSSFVVVDNGDGTVTVSGTDFEVIQIDDTTWEFSSPSVVQIDEHTYTLSSP